jgi:hypothetical protein
MEKYNRRSVLLLSLVFTGCASLTKEECQSINWYEQARADVQDEGREWREEFEHHLESCQEHGVAISEKAYLDGVRYEGAIACSGAKDFHIGQWAELGKTDALKGYSLERTKTYQRECSFFQVDIDQADFSKGFQQGIKRFCTKEQGRAFGESGGDYKNTCPKSTEKTFLSAYIKGRKVYTFNKTKNELKEAREDRYELREELADLRAKKLSLMNQESKVRHDFELERITLSRQLRRADRNLQTALSNGQKGAVINGLYRKRDRLQRQLTQTENAHLELNEKRNRELLELNDEIIDLERSLAKKENLIDVFENKLDRLRESVHGGVNHLEDAAEKVRENFDT